MSLLLSGSKVLPVSVLSLDLKSQKVHFLDLPSHSYYRTIHINALSTAVDCCLTSSDPAVHPAALLSVCPTNHVKRGLPWAVSFTPDQWATATETDRNTEAQTDRQWWFGVATSCLFELNIQLDARTDVCKWREVSEGQTQRQRQKKWHTDSDRKTSGD